MTLTATAKVHEQVVDLPTARVNYLDAGSGPAVVLLHGSGPGATGATNFTPNIAPLAEHFRVITPDMPGWGQSNTPTEPNNYNHVGVLIELLDHLGIEKAALIGNSMGGFTSVSTAILHPERVSHVVTMGAGAPGNSLIFAPGPGLSEGLKVLAHAYYEPTAENVKKLVGIMCYDPAWATDELAQARAEATLAHQDHLEYWKQNFFKGSGIIRTDLAGKAREITAPTMAIHGRDDRVVPYESSLHLVAQIPNSRLVLLNRCGHWAQIEHAAEFNRLVTDFILNN